VVVSIGNERVYIPPRNLNRIDDGQPGGRDLGRKSDGTRLVFQLTQVGDEK
jgi:hypothetical protein